MAARRAAPSSGSGSSPIAVQAVFVLARTGAVLRSDELSGRDMGYVLGTALSGLVFALVIRWIYVRLRGGGPVLRSQLGPDRASIVIAFLSLLGSLRPG